MEAHDQLEELILDRDTMETKKKLGSQFAQIVYEGKWFTPLREAIQAEIRKKDGDLVGQMASEGTTPRRLTDLIGSLSDLTSGSGDKGTPVILIQGYFDNYTN